MFGEECEMDAQALREEFISHSIVLCESRPKLLLLDDRKLEAPWSWVSDSCV